MTMFDLLPVFAVPAAGMAGCVVWAVCRWWQVRRRLDRVFYAGRERRLDPQMWGT